MRLSLQVLTFYFINSFIFTQINCFEKEENLRFHLPGLIHKIIDIFQSEQTDFLIINFGNNSDLLNGFASNALEERNWPTKLSSVENSDDFQLEESALLIFDTFKSLQKFNNEVTLTNKFPKKLSFFVICQATEDEISSLSSVGETTEENTILQFQYFVIDGEKSMELKTFVWYTEEKCRQPQLVNVNKYWKASQTWASNEFLIEKFENFYGCLVVFDAIYQPPALYFLPNPFFPGRWVPMGYLKVMMVSLATVLNFRIVIIPHDRSRSFDFPIFEESFNRYHQITAENLTITQPFAFHEEFLLIPPGKAYTGYEKILLPFDNQVWGWIIATFLSAFITIFILSFSKPSVRKFVIGSCVKTPTLNVFIIFFGLSPIKLPGRNFARFLTVAFVMYSLVIRTAYQGKMFEFLQKDMRKPEIQSIDELLDKEFDFYIHPRVLEWFDNSSEIIRK